MAKIIDVGLPMTLECQIDSAVQDLTEHIMSTTIPPIDEERASWRALGILLKRSVDRLEQVFSEED